MRRSLRAVHSRCSASLQQRSLRSSCFAQTALRGAAAALLVDASSSLGAFYKLLHGASRATRRYHSNHGDQSKPLCVEFVLPDGTVKCVQAYEGQNLLDVCAENDLPMEGACGGSCACSTCHVYLPEDGPMADAFPEPTDQENDMIDQAFFPQPTSRLGCQLVLQQGKHDGLRVTLPKATRNMYVDGTTAKPH